MDPNTALYSLLSNIDCVDRDEAHKDLEDLLDWLSDGGFEPVVLDRCIGLARFPRKVKLTLG